MHSPPCSFDDLPPDFLVPIFRNFWIGDRVRLRLVCKTWNQILKEESFPTAPEAPWEILSNDSYDEPESHLTKISFKSLSEKRIYRFKLPNIEKSWCRCGSSYCSKLLNNIVQHDDDIRGGCCRPSYRSKLLNNIVQHEDDIRGWCCGSSRGWLLMAMGHNFNPYMLLWNPLSGITRKLPRLSTLPFFNDFVNAGRAGKIQNLSSVIHRVEVFSVDTVECVVAIIFRYTKTNQIALSTPRERRWTVFGSGEEDESICYKDILYHTKSGRLLALAYETFSSETEREDYRSKKFEILLTDCRVKMFPVLIKHFVENVLVIPQTEAFQILSRTGLNTQLVESPITQDLLVVDALSDCFGSNGGPPFERFRCQQTREIFVNNIDKEEGLTLVGEIRDEAIFLGATGSFSVPIVHGVVPNSIYFAIDDARGWVMNDWNTNKDDFVVREHGVFSLQDNIMEEKSVIQIKGYHPQSKVGWFTPQLL